MGIVPAISAVIPVRTHWASHIVGINGGIILFNAMLILILWAFVLSALRPERAYVIDAAIQRNDSLVIALEQYVVRTIESADAVIRYLIRERGRYGDKLDLADFVEKYTVDYSALTGVVLADERGDAVTTTYPATPVRRTNVADREHFRVHIDRDNEVAEVAGQLKRVSLDAEEAVLEVRAKSLQTELVAKQVEKALLARTTESRERELSLGHKRMRELRGGDAAHPGRK